MPETNPFFQPSEVSQGNPFLRDVLSGVQIQPGQNLPEVPEEQRFLKSEEGQAIIQKGIRSPEDLTSEEKRIFDKARELIPSINQKALEFASQKAAFDNAELERKSPGRAFEERVKGYIPLASVDWKIAAAKIGVDYLSYATKPLLEFFESEAAAEPWPISPERNLVEDPLTRQEEIAASKWEMLSRVDRDLSWARRTSLKGVSGALGFFTQSLDPIVNPQKYGTTSQKATTSMIEGFVDMITEAPDQFAYQAEVFFGSKRNPISPLLDAIGTIVNLPKLKGQGPTPTPSQDITGKLPARDKPELSLAEQREAIRKKAINHFYKNPEGMWFTLMITHGAWRKGTKGLREYKEVIEAYGKVAKARVAEDPGMAKTVSEAHQRLRNRLEEHRQAAAEAEGKTAPAEPTPAELASFEREIRGAPAVEEMSRTDLVIEADKLQQGKRSASDRIPPGELVKMERAQLEALVMGEAVPEAAVLQTKTVRTKLKSAQRELATRESKLQEAEVTVREVESELTAAKKKWQDLARPKQERRITRKRRADKKEAEADLKSLEEKRDVARSNRDELREKRNTAEENRAVARRDLEAKQEEIAAIERGDVVEAEVAADRVTAKKPEPETGRKAESAVAPKLRSAKEVGLERAEEIVKEAAEAEKQKAVAEKGLTEAEQAVLDLKSEIETSGSANKPVMEMMLANLEGRVARDKAIIAEAEGAIALKETLPVPEKIGASPEQVAIAEAVTLDKSNPFTVRADAAEFPPGSEQFTVIKAPGGEFSINFKKGEATPQKIVEVINDKLEVRQQFAAKQEAKAEPTQELEPPSIIKTGNEPADVSRNLGHTKGFVKTLEKRIADEKTTPAERERFKQQLGQAVRDVERFEADKARIQEGFAKEETIPLEHTPVDILKTNEIQADPARFQEREGAYSRQSVERIKNDYNPVRFDPIIVWKDPKDGKTYVLAGHSRLQTMRELKKSDLPAKYFEGTEKQAIDFAKIEANRGQTKPGLLADVGAFELSRDRGDAKKKLIDEFGSDRVNKLDAFTYLDKSGQFMKAMTDPASDSFPYIERWGRTIGQIRKEFPELTNRHETQIFDAVYKDPGMIDWHKADFRDLIEKQVTDMRWNSDHPLIFKKGHIPVTGYRARADIGPTIRKIDDLNKRWKEAKTEEERTALRSEADKLRDKLDEFADTQGNIFEEIKPTQEFGSGSPFSELSSRGRIVQKSIEEHNARVADGHLTDAPAFLVAARKDIGISSGIRSTSNLYGLPAGQKAWYGEAARQVVRNIVLTNRDIIVEMGQRGEIIESIIVRVHKDDWGKKGEKWYDHIVDPSRDGELKPTTLEATKDMRDFLKAEFDEVLDISRKELTRWVPKLIEREYRRRNNLVDRRLSEGHRAALREEQAAGIEARLPDGIENYLPQIHPGQYTAKVREGENLTQIGTGRTQNAALQKAGAHYAKNPNISPDAYEIDGPAHRLPSDLIRTSDAGFNRAVNNITKAVNAIADLADGPMSAAEVRGFLVGTLGTKSGKKKFGGFLQKREGVVGFTKDIRVLLGMHNAQFTRWKNLREISEKTQPIIDRIRNVDGHPNIAENLELNRDLLWGVPPTKISGLLDASLQSKLNPLRDHVAPQALERWLGYSKGGAAIAYIKGSPKWHILNYFQKLQTDVPLTNVPQRFRGQMFFESPEGKAAIKRHGIQHLTGGKVMEAGQSFTSAKTREAMGVLATETRNQLQTWSLHYKIARDKGMGDMEANDYAFINGNLQAHFLSIATDQPTVFRGPFKSTAFLFRRFQIKNLELGANLIASRNYVGAAKWLGAQLLLGGTRAITGPIGKVAAAVGITQLPWFEAETYQRIKNEYGEDAANMIAYGFPGYWGLDLSYTIQMIDMPFGNTLQEQIGNTLLGPIGAPFVAAYTARQETKGLEENRNLRSLRSVIQKIPSLRWLEALEATFHESEKGTFDFRDPSGRLKFKGQMKEILVKVLGGRTTTEGEIDILSEGITSVEERRSEVLDIIAQRVVRSLETGEVIDFSDVMDWNELWPQFPIYLKAVKARAEARFKVKDLDRLDRLLYNSPKMFRYHPITTRDK